MLRAPTIGEARSIPEGGGGPTAVGGGGRRRSSGDGETGADGVGTTDPSCRHAWCDCRRRPSGGLAARGRRSSDARMALLGLLASNAREARDRRRASMPRQAVTMRRSECGCRMTRARTHPPYTIRLDSTRTRRTHPDHLGGRSKRELSPHGSALLLLTVIPTMDSRARRVTTPSSARMCLKVVLHLPLCPRWTGQPSNTGCAPAATSAAESMSHNWNRDLPEVKPVFPVAGGRGVQQRQVQADGVA